MTFREAAQYKMPFGKHKGKTLDSIAETDEGLKYLDRLLGDMQHNNSKLPVVDELKAYLTDPAIKAELRRV